MENIAFAITFEDFEALMDRKLTEKDKILILHKFSIDNWSEEVGYFIDNFLEGENNGK